MHTLSIISFPPNLSIKVNIFSADLPVTIKSNLKLVFC